MNTEFLTEFLIPIIFGVIFVIVFIIFIVIAVKDYKATIKRAQKIDPTVRTMTEAHYVLQKEIAKDFGSNKNNK